MLIPLIQWAMKVHVSMSTAYRLVHTGAIPSMRLSAGIMVDEDCPRPGSVRGRPPVVVGPAEKVERRRAQWRRSQQRGRAKG